MTHVLYVRRRTAGADDAHGNPTVTYGSELPWTVRAIAPGASDRTDEVGRDASHIEWTVYADADERVPGEYDLVLVDGVEYGVEGRPADWTRGPWPHPTAGVVVELKRVEG